MFRRLFWVVAFVLALGLTAVAETADSGIVRIGLFTDVHAHDTDSPNEHKVMVNYAERISAFVAAMTAWSADAIVQLGDLVNGAFVMGAPLGDPARIVGILDDVLGLLAPFPGPVLHVLGNHDVYDLTKQEFLAGTGSEETFYSYDLGLFHFVVLDAQFTKAGTDVGRVGWMVQGTVPEAELAWLRADLAATAKPTVILIHQPLDVAFDLLAGGAPVSNAAAVRAALVESGNVIAVFQGHDHEDRYQVIDGVPYVTFAAMVDHDVATPPSWAAITLDPQTRTIHVEGVSEQATLDITF
ncbi:MAG: metallophosphoesterase [Candidatus Bipolaricaulota bacterium]